jgi:branched-chain amino acid transport system ATP-binding protein
VSLLRVEAISSYYGDLRALTDIDVAVATGETVAVIGANGAGKSTLLRSIMGLTQVRTGEIYFDDRPITKLRTYQRVRLGLALVPEGRHVFPSLSVEENLRIGADRVPAGAWTIDSIFELFPLLQPRRRAPAGVLSGGEQQALAIGRGLAANPRLLLLDEVSLGLAPVIVRELYAALTQVAAAGTTVVVVEQDVQQAMRVSDRVYCLLEGHVSLTGPTRELDIRRIGAAYFGITTAKA